MAPRRQPPGAGGRVVKTCTSRVAEGVHPRSSAGSAAHDPGPSGEAAAAPQSQHPVPGGASSGALPGVGQVTR